MQAMILAAGRGERMRPLTDTCPKPLLCVAGKPIIVWQIERLVAAGITELVINHAHLGKQIESALGDGSRYGARIAYSAEETALETAGGVVQALHLLHDAPFLVVSADIYAECDYRELVDSAADLADGSLAYLWMVANREWHPQGDFALIDGFLRATGEPRLTYSNLGIYRPEFFAGVVPGTRLPLRPLLDRAIAVGKVRGACYEGLWENIGTPEQLNQFNEHLRQHRAA
ncbi:MAG: nucleotidyltransferase family protein [Betaproteobacteria bacterium]|nr:nucleotidyltransferase family protein [Betaproteobacteria bacterium]